MRKICEKCKINFECKMDDITNCFCYTIHLNIEQLAVLKELYANCLCENCLKEVANENQ